MTFIFVPFWLRACRFRSFATVMVCAVALVGCVHTSASSPLPPGQRNSAAFEDASSHEYRVLFNFGTNVYGLDGIAPVAPLIDANGTLYGTTANGGAYNSGGTVFSVSTSGLNERVLYSFRGNSPSEGGPVAGLINLKGTLYGATAQDGLYRGGTVFKVSTSGTNERVLHNFGHGSDGANVRANLTALRGRLYGTTYQGGTYGKGTVFSVRISDGKEHVLHSFGNKSDGANPVAGLIDVNGTLYGTTLFGGANGAGTVFTISIGGSESVLYSFSGPDGAYPYAGLIDLGRTLYGTTGGGGQAKDGTVFSLSTSGTNERVLHSFSNNHSDGIAPVAPVIAVKGALYGTTSQGGAAGYGTAFRVTTSGKERVLHSFGEGYPNDGLDPLAGLIDVKGTLYGTTPTGGISLPSCPRSGTNTCDYGTVFALTP